jgi:UDP-N-acetyl-D-glucosamine dehydrogenase
MLSELLKKIDDKSYTVGIIGLGYVGLPLLWTAYTRGFPVIGVDIDAGKVNRLKAGESYIKHFAGDKAQALALSEKVRFSTDFSLLKEADALIMCVPTPLNAYREPDMSYVEGTTRAIAPHLRKGHLVVLESTTYPGTTDELIRPICEQTSGLKSEQDFYIAYSPEREDPGNPDFNTATIPKVVGGDGAEALELAVKLYSNIVVQTVPVRDTKTAEAVKLLENIYRAVNIALVNEMKIVFQDMGIDIHEVIEAAKTKPFGYTAFYPGPGWGGHCIPIDPFYLTWKAREYGKSTRFIELAGEINTNMPIWVVERVIDALNDQGKAMNGSKILCVGLAYKPNVDDMRESPTFRIMDLLKDRKAKVSYYDPYIPVITPTREHAAWTGTPSVVLSKETVEQFDAVVVCTHHSCINWAELLSWSKLVVDTRHVVPASEKTYKA